MKAWEKELMQNTTQGHRLVDVSQCSQNSYIDNWKVIR